MANGKSENSVLAARDRVVLGRPIEQEHIQSIVAMDKAEEDSALLTDVIANLRETLGQKKQVEENLEQKLTQCQQELESVQASLLNMQSELDILKQEAESRGYEAGLEKSTCELQNALTQQAEEWQQSIKQLIEQHDEFCCKLKSQIIDIVMAAVTRIIGDQITTVEAIRQGLDHIVRESGELQSIKIFVAPNHYEKLMALKNFRLNAVRGREIELYPDTRIEYGGCILEGAGGLVDGRYEVQLARLRDLIQASATELMA